MSQQTQWEYLRAIYTRYRQAARANKRRILDEFCQVAGYHRKSALRLLNGPPPAPARRPRRKRAPRQMDRRLQPYTRQIQRRLYGRSKPGTLLKHPSPSRPSAGTS